MSNRWGAVLAIAISDIGSFGLGGMSGLEVDGKLRFQDLGRPGREVRGQQQFIPLGKRGGLGEQVPHRRLGVERRLREAGASDVTGG